MVRDAHLVKSNLFSVFEENVWPPNVLKPPDIENTVFRTENEKV